MKPASCNPLARHSRSFQGAKGSSVVRGRHGWVVVLPRTRRVARATGHVWPLEGVVPPCRTLRGCSPVWSGIAFVVWPGWCCRPVCVRMGDEVGEGGSSRRVTGGEDSYGRWGGVPQADVGPGRERIAGGRATPDMVRGMCLALAGVSRWRRLCDGFGLVWAGGPVTHGVG